MYGYEAQFLPEELLEAEPVERLATFDSFALLLAKLAEHHTGRTGSDATLTRAEMDALFLEMLNAEKARQEIEEKGSSPERQAVAAQGEVAKQVVIETTARWGRRIGLASVRKSTYSQAAELVLSRGKLPPIASLNSPYAEAEDRMQSGIMGVIVAIPRYLERFQIAVEDGTLHELPAFSTIVAYASYGLIREHSNSRYIRETLGVRLKRRKLEAISAVREKYKVSHISLVRREQVATKEDYDHVLALQDVMEASKHISLDDISFPYGAPEEGAEEENEDWMALSIQEVYPDRNWQSGFNLVEDMMARQQITEVLESAPLTTRELAVLALRGGLSIPGFAAGSYTLAEVGLLLGTDSPSVSLSGTKAARKILRSPARIKALMDSLQAVAVDTTADRAFTGDRLRTGRVTTPKDDYWRRLASLRAETAENAEVEPEAEPKVEAPLTESEVQGAEPPEAEPSAQHGPAPEERPPLRPELVRPAEKSRDQAPPFWTRYLQDTDISRGPVRPKTQSYELVYKALKEAVLDSVGHLAEGVHPSHPARLYEELSRYLSPYLTVQHLETFWNREVPRLIGDRRLDKSVAVDTNHLGRLVSRLLADRLADGDTVKLVIPEGAEGRCSYLGAWANRGTITIVGEAGDYTGAYIGGTAVVLVEGNVGDYAGVQAQGESYLVVDGHAGGHTGEGAYGLSTIAIQEAAEAPIALGISDEASVVVANREWLASTTDRGRPLSGGEEAAEQPEATAYGELEQPEEEEESEPELEADREEKEETIAVPEPEELPETPVAIEESPIEEPPEEIPEESPIEEPPEEIPEESPERTVPDGLGASAGSAAPEPEPTPSIAAEPEVTVIAGMVVETPVSKSQATTEQTLEFNDAASWLGVSTDQLQLLATQLGHEGQAPLILSQFLAIQHRLADDDDLPPDFSVS